MSFSCKRITTDLEVKPKAFLFPFYTKKRQEGQCPLLYLNQ